MKKYILKVQEYLLTHSLDDLIKDHGIYHRVYNHKMSLNYDQLEAKDDDLMAQECRGLVLAHNYDVVDPNIVFGETEILAMPFFRFFNYGQGAAANINFDKVKFWSKEDGTLLIFYWDEYVNKWCAATRSVPEANLTIDGFDEYTFTTLFQKAIHHTTGMSYDSWLEASNLVKDVTYMFELCTPSNRIVVQYNDYKVWLTGMRNKLTGNEYNIEHYGPVYAPLIPICPSYDLSNIQDMIKLIETQNPLEYEGIVACDDLFRRVKVKNPSYVAYNKLRDSLTNSPRALMQIILSEKLDDLQILLPEHILNLGLKYQESIRKLFHDFHIQYEECMKEVNNMGFLLSDKEKQKQFALAVQRRKAWLGPMMVMFNGKAKSLKDYLEQQKTVEGEYKKSLLDHLINVIK